MAYRPSVGVFLPALERARGNRRLPALIGAAGTSLVLTLACGGGGGGTTTNTNNPSSGVSLSLVTPNQIVDSLAQGTLVPDQVIEVQASGNLNSLAGQTIYAEIVDPDSLFAHNTPLTVSQGPSGTFSTTLTGLLQSNAAHYTGNLQILVSTDPTFTTQLTNSPLSLPFNVTVTGTSVRSVIGFSNNVQQLFDAGTGAMTGGASVPNPHLSSTDVKAVLADGNTVLQGTFSLADGSFLIPNVPSGHYWLQAGTDYVWTSAANVSLSWQGAGRATSLDTQPVNSTFDVTNMTAWGANDYLLAYDYNSGLHLSWKGASDGSTLLNQSISWLGLPLLDTTQGDAPQLIQYVDSIQGSVHVSAPANECALPGPMTMVDGDPFTVNAALSPITLTATVPVYFARSAFAGYRAQYNPAKQITWGPFMEADSLPGATAVGAANSWLDGVCWQDSNSANTADVTQGDIPAPALASGFQRVFYAGETHYMPLTAPGASPLSYQVRGIRSYTLTPPTSAVPIQPLVSPAKNPTLNDLNSLFTNQTVASLTPRIAWTAPDLGTPQEYEVVVLRLGASAGTTTTTEVARLILPNGQTSFILPAGIAAHGQTYVFLIRSYVDSLSAPETYPFYYHKFPYGLSETISGQITFN